MVQVSLSAEDYSALDSQELDDLYANLALTDAGTAGTMGLSLNSLSSLKSVMSAEGATSGGVLSWLIHKGKALFNSLWPGAKSLVCAIYKQDGDDQSKLKGWVEKVAAALVGLLNITAAVAILIVSIAIKLGLDAICDTGASDQPA